MDASSTGSKPRVTTTVASTTRTPSTVASITPSKTNTASSQAASEAAGDPKVKQKGGNTEEGEESDEDDLTEEEASDLVNLAKCLANQNNLDRALGNVSY